MGEKGNGGHVASGGDRAVRSTPTGMGMQDATAPTQAASAGGGGGGGLLDSLGDAKDKVQDVGGGVAFGRRENESDDQ
jgi:hypothetical protein